MAGRRWSLLVLALVLGALFVMQGARVGIGAEEAGLSEKLDRVLKNQEKMMQDLQLIRVELGRIRIRVN